MDDEGRYCGLVDMDLIMFIFRPLIRIPHLYSTESSSAIISAALPNEATYDIEYENGEKGRSLPLKCLRRPEGG